MLLLSLPFFFFLLPLLGAFRISKDLRNRIDVPGRETIRKTSDDPGRETGPWRGPKSIIRTTDQEKSTIFFILYNVSFGHVTYMKGNLYAKYPPPRVYVWPGLSTQDSEMLFQPVLGYDESDNLVWTSEVYNPNVNPNQPQAHATEQLCKGNDYLSYKMWHSPARGDWMLSTSVQGTWVYPHYNDVAAYKMTEIFFAVEVLGRIMGSIDVYFENILFTVQGTHDPKWCRKENFLIGKGAKATVGNVFGWPSKYGIKCHIASIWLQVPNLLTRVE